MWPFIIIGVFAGTLIEGFSGAWVGGAIGFFVWMLIDSQIQKSQHDLQEKVSFLESELAKIKHGEIAVVPPITAKTKTAASATEEIVQTISSPEEDIETAPAPASPPVLAEEITDTWSPNDYSIPSTSLWQKLISGNILAKIGAVLMFFGVASALKLAAEHGFFPIQLRLFIGALIATGMVGLGYNKANTSRHRMFGLSLQGGGFAILYLLVNFMLTRYGMLGHTTAFIAFALLGMSCTLLAARQNGAALAVLGMAGAFIAPILASDGSGNYVALFSYFVLLNCFILLVNWFSAWRSLNITGFLMTFIIGMGWALRGYQPAHFGNVEIFLILFFVMYSLTPVLYALFKAAGLKGWQEGILVFGVPLAAAGIQHKLLDGNDIALAWWALAAGIYYLVLWWMLNQKNSNEMRLMERSHLGIAIAFLTIAIPLAFGTQLTVALWAAEGSAVVWLGCQQNRLLARYAGSALQLVAGAYFLAHITPLSHQIVILNDVFIGMAIVAFAGLFTARQLQKIQTDIGLSRMMLIWSGLWWLCAGLVEINTFTPHPYKDAVALLFAGGSAMAWELLGRKMAWPDFRRMGWLHYAASVVAPMYALSEFHHVLHDLMSLVFPLAVLGYGWLLHRQDADKLDSRFHLYHSLFYWQLVLLTGHEASWLADSWTQGNLLWPLLAWGAVLGGALMLTLRAYRQNLWPFYAHPRLDFLLTPVAILAALWAVAACIAHDGGASGLPYLPLLSFYDMTHLFVFAALLSFCRFSAISFEQPAKCGLLLLPCFVWLSSMAARIAHHWGGVAFTMDALKHSGMFQTSLSLIWSILAISLMIVAGKTQNRLSWYTGFSLLGIVCAKLLMLDLANAGTVAWTISLIGIAILVIAASYFSPIPPAATKNKV